MPHLGICAVCISRLTAQQILDTVEQVSGTYGADIVDAVLFSGQRVKNLKGGFKYGCNSRE